MVVAGRVVTNSEGVEDVAIMMVEAESTMATWDLVKHQGKGAPTEPVVAEGLEASKKFIAALCKAQAELAAKPPSRSRTSRCSLSTRTTCMPPSRALSPAT